MDRETLLKHLGAANRHIHQAASDIACQRKIIEGLKDLGQHMAQADHLLRALEASLAMQVAARDAMTVQLGGSNSP